MAALPLPLSKLSSNQSFVAYDDHTAPHRGVTVPQLTLFVVWVTAIVLWLAGRAGRANLLPRLWPISPGTAAADEAPVADDGASTKLLANGSQVRDGFVAVSVQTDVIQRSSVETADREHRADNESSDDRHTYDIFQLH